MTDTADPRMQEAEDSGHHAMRALGALLKAAEADGGPTAANLWNTFEAAASDSEIISAGVEETDLWDALVARLAQVRGHKTRIMKLDAAVQSAIQDRKKAAAVAEIEARLNARASVADCLDDCAPPEGICPSLYLRQLRMPAGYEINRNGVYKLTVQGVSLKRTRICHRPMFTVSRAIESQTDSASRQVVWLGPDRWYSKIVPRADLLTTTGLLSLINFEAPIDGNNCKNMMTFLSRFDQDNASLMHAVVSSSQMGWQPDNSFLIGHDHIGGDAEAPILVKPPEGMETIPGAWVSHGTWEGWLSAARIVKSQPYMIIALAASVASPLLHVLGHNGFTVDFAGETTGGKTTALRFAVSAWGNPTDDYPSALYSWASTRVWVERANGFLNTLPMCLDDTKKARTNRIPRDICYEHPNGQGAGRGTIAGTQASVSWRNVIISTGEAGICDHHTDGGLRGRVLTVRGKPLGHRPQDGARMAESLYAGLANHHGHLGRRVAAYLVKTRKDWSMIRRLFKELTIEYGAAATNAVARRHAGNLAVIDIAIRIMKNLGVAVECEVDPMVYLTKSVIAAGKDADQPMVALQQLFTWAAAKQSLFWGRHATDQDGAPRSQQGWAGAWSSTETWDTIAFLPATLEGVLKRLGHTPAEIITRWTERGWFDLRIGVLPGTALVPMKIQGLDVPCYLFDRTMYESILMPTRDEGAEEVELAARKVQEIQDRDEEEGTTQKVEPPRRPRVTQDHQWQTAPPEV